MELIHELNQEGATIAVITHDTEIAARLPRQVRIRDGRVVEDIGPGATDGRAIEDSEPRTAPVPEDVR